MTTNNMKKEKKVETFRINHSICVQKFPNGIMTWISCSEPTVCEIGVWESEYPVDTFGGLLPEYPEFHYGPLLEEFHDGKATLVEIVSGCASMDYIHHLLFLAPPTQSFWRPVEFREAFLKKLDSLELWTETNEWVPAAEALVLVRAEVVPGFKEEAEEEIIQTLQKIEHWKEWQEANGGPRYSDRRKWAPIYDEETDTLTFLI